MRAPLCAPVDAQRPLIDPLAARNPPLRPSRASWSARARRAEELERILDHRRAHARPWQADAVALRHRRRRPARRASRRCCSRRWPRTTRDAPPAQAREGATSSRIMQGAAGRARLGAGRGPQDPGLGAAAVVRRGGHEPAARRPRARLCRRLGDRLARLFASASAPPSAGPASGSPASSSSAMPARELEERPRPPLATVSEAVAAASILSFID